MQLGSKFELTRHLDGLAPKDRAVETATTADQRAATNAFAAAL